MAVRPSCHVARRKNAVCYNSVVLVCVNGEQRGDKYGIAFSLVSSAFQTDRRCCVTLHAWHRAEVCVWGVGTPALIWNKPQAISWLATP